MLSGGPETLVSACQSAMKQNIRYWFCKRTHGRSAPSKLPKWSRPWFPVGFMPDSRRFFVSSVIVFALRQADQEVVHGLRRRQDQQAEQRRHGERDEHKKAPLSHKLVVTLRLCGRHGGRQQVRAVEWVKRNQVEKEQPDVRLHDFVGEHEVGVTGWDHAGAQNERE